MEQAQWRAAGRGAWRVVEVVLATVVVAGLAPAQERLWLEQLGSNAYDRARAATADGSGGVLVAGNASGPIPGASGSGPYWAARLDGTGSATWIRQFGPTGLGGGMAAAAADGTGGGYVAGSTRDDFGGPNAGDLDCWVARLDAAGSLLWVRQFGTVSVDLVHGACEDGIGGMYLTGQTNEALGGPYAGGGDAWVARYDAAGNRLWITQLGTSESDPGFGVAPDGAGGVLVCGETTGVLAPPGVGFCDPWVARYDGAGNQLWIRQTGCVWSDGARAAASDGAGGVYIGGWTTGDFGGTYAGKWDAWLARYDAAGNELWVRQLGTAEWEELRAAALDPAGGVYVGGLTGGDLGGGHVWSDDAWVARYDAAGNLLWVDQIGTSGEEETQGLATIPTGGVYACGGTGGVLVPPSNGLSDAWIARYAGDCPDPTTYCTSKPSSIPGCTPAMSFSGAPCASAGKGFEVAVGPLPGKKPGLWIYTTQGAATTPLQNAYGWLCIATIGVHRVAPGFASGTPGACDGELAFDFNAFAWAQTADPTLVAGATVDLQAWYRDPPSPGGANLTEAGRFVLCP